MIRKILVWSLSFLVGGSVIIGLVLLMSNLINVESTLQADQVKGKTYLVSDLNRQCDEHIEKLLVLVSISQSCQKDDDCDVVDFRYGYKEMGSCPFPVQKGKADLVYSAVSKIGSCVQRYCRDLPRNRGNSLMAICQNNICTSEYIPSIAPDRLKAETLDSINENLIDEGASG